MTVRAAITKLGFTIDSFLNRYGMADIPASDRIVHTDCGAVRVRDSGKGAATVVLVPDGPCVVEHLDELIARLSATHRVVAFDMPGLGFSKPAKHYDHSLAMATRCMLQVFDELAIDRAILNFTCVNGYYALAFAKQHPDRVRGVILGQTPSPSAMADWVDVNIPRSLRLPLVGQLVAFKARSTLATIWFGIALPKGTSRDRWRERSQANLKSGGCFCLASVVQGLAHNPDDAFIGVSAPVISLWGADDRSHAKTDPLSLKAIVPQLDLRVLPGVGHFPNLEVLEPIEQAIRELTQG